MNRPDLLELDAFASVARHRNFKKAASERGVTASALSHAIRNLETRLGVRLLNRTTRSVTPTEAGEMLLLRLAPALSDIGEALEGLNQFRATPRGTLRLNVPRAAARMLLAPAFARFRASYPDIRLEIVTDDGLVDIVAGGFDAGIRFGETLAKDMVAVPLGPEQRFVVAATPDFIARHGAPNQPQELSGYPCIGRRFPSGVVYAWEFSKAGEAMSVALDSPFLLDDDDLMLEAALSGVGYAYLFETRVKDLLQQGRLASVLDDWCAPMPGFYLYYPSRRQMPATLRAFIDVLRSQHVIGA
jgi:DNA-binding transcriptional LysR family regulator